jgi:hypothetical protein
MSMALLSEERTGAGVIHCECVVEEPTAGVSSETPEG